jgi:hypothetical protein
VILTALEVWYLVQVTEIYHSEVLNPVSNLVENFILTHTPWIVVAAETDDDEAFFFTEDGLVDVPASSQVWKDYGAHNRLTVLNKIQSWM